MFFNIVSRYDDYIKLIQELIEQKKEKEPEILKQGKEKGRPKANKADIKNVRDFINSDEECYTKVLKVLKTRFHIGGAVELAKAVLALQRKDYFSPGKSRAELYYALFFELGDIGGYNNFGKRLRSYDDRTYSQEIDKIEGLLP